MIETLDQASSQETLTQAAFDQLLSAFDAASRDEAGAKYVELRDHLRQFFSWRGAAFPEDAADETLNRVARKLAAGEQILDFRSYVFGVARYLMFEINRLEERKRLALAELPAVQTIDKTPEKQLAEARFGCLEKCLQKLSESDRSLIINYYQGERNAKIMNRKTLLEKLNLSPSGLRMKTLRLREQLENCLQICLSGGAAAV